MLRVWAFANKVKRDVKVRIRPDTGSLSAHIIIPKSEPVANRARISMDPYNAPSQSHSQFPSSGFKHPNLERSPVEGRRKNKVINEL